MGKHVIDALLHGLLIVVGMHRQLLELFERTHRRRGRGCDQHDTGQTCGPARGERLGHLAAHGMSNQDVVPVPRCRDHRLGIVGEPLYVVGPRRVHGVTPTPLVVVHESLIGLQASEHWPPGAPRTSPVVQEDQRRGRAPTCVGVKHCTVDVYDALDGVRRSHCWIATGEGDELVECGGVVRHQQG
jgi:hypothetical protein